jgi:hypothetical protein
MAERAPAQIEGIEVGVCVGVIAELEAGLEPAAQQVHALRIGRAVRSAR